MFGSVCNSVERVWRVCSDVRECAAMLGSVQRSRLGSVQRGLRMCSEVWECMQECTVTLESVQ